MHAATNVAHEKVAGFINGRAGEIPAVTSEGDIECLDGL